jgi:hypothetical protein
VAAPYRDIFIRPLIQCIRDLTLSHPFHRQFNDPVRNAMTQFGLSILRFSGSDLTEAYGGDANSPIPEYVAQMDVRMIRNEFVDNIYFLSSDAAVSATMRYLQQSLLSPVRSQIAHSIILSFL